jgi:hypothetical protein
MFPLSTLLLPAMCIALPGKPDQAKRHEYLGDHKCPVHAFRPIFFEFLDHFSEAAMLFIREVPHEAFPGAQAASVWDRCISNIFSHLAVVRCRHTSLMLTAAAGLQTAHTGSGWIRGFAHPAADMHSQMLEAAWLSRLDVLALCRPLAPCLCSCVGVVVSF